MPQREHICPTCRSTAAPRDAYCSSCGAILPGIDSADQAVTPPLVSSGGRPHDLHPLHIVPDTSRQRRRLLRRVVALVATVAIACLFAVTIVMAGDRRDQAGVQALAIAFGLLTMLAIGGWIRLGVRRVRKRDRRQHWQMSAF